MSEALVKVIPVDELKQLSTMLSKSTLLPPALRGKEADIAVTVMAGRELGLAPMASLRNIHVVEGKPVLSADMMVGVALSSGLALYFKLVEGTAQIATYETHRKGDPGPQRMSFTIEEARAANLLNKNNWRQYAPAMLRARAKAALARDVYPDALSGCYIPDEAEEFDSVSIKQAGAEPAEGDVIDVTPVPSRVAAYAAQLTAQPEPPPLYGNGPTPEQQAAADVYKKIDAAMSEADLEALGDELKALPAKAKTAARRWYKARLEAIRSGNFLPSPPDEKDPMPDWIENVEPAPTA